MKEYPQSQKKEEKKQKNVSLIATRVVSWRDSAEFSPLAKETEDSYLRKRNVSERQFQS